MATNDERREVARKLRESRESAWGFRKQLSDEGIDVFCDDQADYYLIHKAVASYIPAEHMHPCDYAELHDRLADLIEPSCDREALLEQAKELEKCAWYFGLDFDADEPLRDRLKEASEDFAECARRIREACGEV